MTTDIKNGGEQAKQVPSCPVKRSFKETLDDVKERIEWTCLPRQRLAAGLELAMIVAEVELLPSDAMVRIDGNDLPAAMVCEIYQRLTHDHIILVLDNLAGITHRICAMKTYMRTALYNSVFVHDTSINNMVKADS